VLVGHLSFEAPVIYRETKQAGSVGRDLLADQLEVLTVFVRETERCRDASLFDGLISRQGLALAVVEPSGDELVDQLDRELAASRRHLRAVLDRYWEQDWRREHRGYDGSPEDHLWRAASAVSEIADTLDQLRT
jgi:hypothetical protein